MTSAQDEIKRREQEIERVLRDQQKPVLQIAAMNKRVVVSGAAGTGKNFYCDGSRSPRGPAGARVALICFNQLIGDWMARRTGSGGTPLPNLVVGRAIRSLLAEMAGIGISNGRARHSGLESYREKIEERLTDPEFRATAAFDYLVVDEAQDLLARPRIWECVTRFLEGGLAKGSFCIFGDFDNQVISDRESMETSFRSLLDSASPTRYHLSENSATTGSLENRPFDSVASTTVFTPHICALAEACEITDIKFYSDDHEQLETLKLWIKEFRTQGYSPSDITVLSFRSSDDSAAVRLGENPVSKFTHSGKVQLTPQALHPFTPSKD